MGSSGLFAFELKQGGQRRDRFVDALTLFGIGYSWGGYESLAIPSDPVRSFGVASAASRTLIRLQIGLENVQDLIDDLGAAFEISGE